MKTNEQIKDPARKRSFDPEPDVAQLLGAWAKENRNVIESRMFNDALRNYLSEYRTKRTPASGRLN